MMIIAQADFHHSTFQVITAQFTGQYIGQSELQ